MRLKTLILGIYTLLLLTGLSNADGSGNLAKSKTIVSQSSTLNSNFPASKAVNGIIDQPEGGQNFTHTNSSGDNKWWMVDLETEYNISRIELYNRPGGNADGLYYNRLAKISILTSTTESPQNLSRGFTDWTNQSYREAPYGPVGIIQFDTPVAAKHVAVFTNNAGALTLVEVEIYESVSLTKPMHLQLRSNSEDCVKLTWQPPGDTGGRVLRYEYKCTNHDWQVVNTPTATPCDDTWDTSVTCSVSAVVVGGASQEDSIHLLLEEENIAAGKTTEQSSSRDGGYTSDLAVNGNISDFTHTEASGIKWWRVDLRAVYQIGRVELFNRQERCDGIPCYQRLSKITILTSTSNSNSPGVPSLPSSGWTNQSYRDEPYGPVGIIQFSTAVAARHVAVFSDNTEDALSLAEVEISRSTKGIRPMNLQLQSGSADCVRLTWQPPQNTGGTIMRYEYQCTGYDWLRVTENPYTVTRCEYEPYTNVTCSVSALVKGGASQEESKFVVTECAVPDTPQLVLDVELEVNGGRNRWKYTASWGAPSRVNCDGTLRYQYGLNGTLDSEQASETSATFYLDGYQLYNFTLVARNSHGASIPAVKSGRSGDIAPQFGTSDVELTSNSSDCIIFKWEHPQFPGRHITYQYKCSGNDDWRNVDDVNNPKYTQSVCRYDPYTHVTCVVNATNLGGSTVATRSVHTLCAVPDTPQLVLDVELEEKDGRKRWKYTASWGTPRVNCNGTLKYRYGLNGTLDSEEITEASATFYLDGHQLYNFTLVARNSHGYSITAVNSSRSGEIAPQFKPRHVKASATSEKCIQLSWEPPEYPGGPNISYEGTCNQITFSTTAHSDNTKETCGYSPYTNVTCYIRARNNAGVSEFETASNYTLCAVPDTPQLVLDDELEENDGRKRWKYTASWGPPSRVNCDGTLKYQYGLNGTLDSAETTETSATFYRDGYQLYNFILVARNSHGDSIPAVNSSRSGEIAPQIKPRQVKVSATSKKCIQLSWEPTEYPGGPNIIYEGTCNEITFNTTAHSDNTKEICGYSPYTNVTCYIRAWNNAGVSEDGIASNYTLCADPSSPDFSVTSFPESVDGNGNHTVTISVSLNEAVPLCRIITEYQINITSTANPEFNQFYANESAGVFNFTGHKAFTCYTVTIVVVNDEDKTSENATTFKTAETAPDTAPNIVSLEADEDCVLLNVTKPSVPNGYITGYRITCTGVGSPKQENITSNEDEKGSAKICEFGPATKVTCTAIAINTEGSSPPTKSTSINTKFKVENKEDFILTVQEQMTSTSVPVTIKGLTTEGATISNYLIMLKPEKKIAKRAAETDSDLCDDDFAQNPQNYSSVAAGGCYVTAVLSAEQVGESTIFTVGDNMTHGSYHNVPLTSNTNYSLSVAIAGSIRGSKTMSAEVKYSISISVKDVDVVTVTPGSITTAGPNSVGAIVGGAIGGVAAAAMVVVGLLLFRRWRHAKDGQTQSDTELSPIPPVPVRDSGEDALYDNMNGVFEGAGMIPISGLDTYIKNNGEVIEQQYEKLERLPKPVMENALLPKNKGRCRYKGLYPSDEHRVILHREDPNRDFINASYISGYSRDRAYIAAQGPTQYIVNDFWYMIWQERPSAIVMVTRAVENGKPKCEQYWPLEKHQDMKFDDISVTLIAAESFADFTVSHLSVSKEGQTRNISHFNYLSWPDHGVPDDLGSYVAFYSRIKSITSRSTRPTLIHCSAGVGRTGTYIALEYLLEQAKKEKAVDLFDCVRKMRERRPCMVQTDDQYIFLHHVLYESLATENFKCSSSEVNSKIKLHRERQRSRPAPPTDRILEEYQHIERRMQSLNLKFTIAGEPDHVGKNRFQEILPCDKYMPFLTNGEGIYINAVFVDAYSQKNQCLVTQLPLSNTISNFWQLIIEQDVNIIVQLESAELPFYPMKDLDSMSTSLHTLVRGDAEDKEYVTIIPLKVQTSKVEKCVRLVVLKSWCRAAEAFPPTDVLLSLCGSVEDLQKKVGNQKICVTCLDGSSRCGLYICASNAIEKLKSEQEVDLYHPTMMSKIRRPQFISSIEQYTFLYEVLNGYTDSFAEYANFQ